jgi:pimeloyl-ACP methyl ester carboxylesterase
MATVTNARAEAKLFRLGGPEGAPDLLLVHGFGSDRFSWSATAPAFMGSHAVWAVELPGHGDSKLGAETDMMTMAAAVAEAVQGKLLRPFPIVAHSLGGAVALELARLHPDMVSYAVLLAPAGLGQRLDGEFLTRFPELNTPEDAEALLHKLVSRPRLISSQMVNHVLAFLGKPRAREYLRSIAGTLLGLRPVAIPEQLATSIVWGDKDEVNPSDPSRLEALTAEIHIIPNTGHMPHVEAARKVNAIILEAISRK